MPDNSSISVPTLPVGVTECEPEVKAATANVYYAQNKRKSRNFIMADLTDLGYLHFYVENLPKDGTGCPGGWLLQLAWDHFTNDQKATIQGVRGDWFSGDNLDMVNRLTAGNRMTLEEASRHTWTYQQAVRRGFSRYQYLDAQGSPGQYISVDVVFLP